MKKPRPKEPKQYPLQIKALRSVDTGDFLGFYSKGIHTPAAFADAVGLSYEQEVDWRRVTMDFVRTVPLHGAQRGVFFVPAREGSPGAFPITYMELVDKSMNFAQARK